MAGSGGGAGIVAEGRRRDSHVYGRCRRLRETRWRARMSCRSLALSMLLCAAGAAFAAEPRAPATADEIARAEAATADIRDAQGYLRDMRTSVELARRGEYG